MLFGGTNSEVCEVWVKWMGPFAELRTTESIGILNWSEQKKKIFKKPKNIHLWINWEALFCTPGCQEQEVTTPACGWCAPGSNPEAGRPVAVGRRQRPASPRGGASAALSARGGGPLASRRAAPRRTCRRARAATRSSGQHRVTTSSYGTPPPPCHSPPRSPPRRSRRCRYRCRRCRPVSTWRLRSPPHSPLSRLPQVPPTAAPLPACHAAALGGSGDGRRHLVAAWPPSRGGGAPAGG